MAERVRQARVIGREGRGRHATNRRTSAESAQSSYLNDTLTFAR